MIQHIFLDLDDTIFDFKKAERIALSRTLREEGIKPTEQILNRYSEINLSQWKLLELGKLTREEVLVRRYEILFQEVGMSCDAKKISEKYEDFLGEGHYFIPGAKELLEDLSKKYYLYLASNGARKSQYTWFPIRTWRFGKRYTSSSFSVPWQMEPAIMRPLPPPKSTAR